MEVKQKTKTIILSLLVLNMVVTTFMVMRTFAPPNGQPDGFFNFDSTYKYVLYIGLNDKDTYEQIVPTEEAIEIINEICIKYTDGYTLDDAKGGWIDENGILTSENSLVYNFIDVSESDIASIMDEVLIALNQNSILLERLEISSIFYNGR